MPETREEALNREPRAASVRRDLELLLAVRRIMQAFDLHSRRLSQSSQITLPQLLCLMAVVAEEGMNSRQIASLIYASASTLVGVLDRLEHKQLVDRVRDPRDRRQVHILPTEAGRRFIGSAPSPFGDDFEARFDALPEAQQRHIVEGLALMAELMTEPGPAA